jgi:hypothetical protein
LRRSTGHCRGRRLRESSKRSQRCDAGGRQAVLRSQVGLLHDQHDDQNRRSQRYGDVGGEFLHLTGGGTLSLSSSLSSSSTGLVGTFTPGIVLIRDISELLLLTGYRTKDARQVSDDGGAGRSSMLSPWNWFECADRKFPVVLGRRDGSLHLPGRRSLRPSESAKPTLGHSWNGSFPQ